MSEKQEYALYVSGHTSYGSFFWPGQTTRFIGFYPYDEAKEKAESYAKNGYSVKLLKVIETCNVDVPALVWNKV